MKAMYSMRSPAVKRLMKEAQELREPTELYFTQPLEDNLFEWHFTIRGPENSDFDGGLYHGRIILPPDYPMKPPNVILLTPNGRFETNKKICLSISGHHPESWQPSWSIRTALLAIIGFMPTHGSGAIGSLDYPPEERKKLAKRTLDWKCENCGNIAAILKPVTEASKAANEEAKELASQINFRGEKSASDNKPAEEVALSSTASAPVTTATSSTASTPITTPPNTPVYPAFPNMPAQFPFPAFPFPQQFPHMANTPQQQQQQQGSNFVPRFPFPPTFLPSMFAQMRMSAGNPFIAANQTSGFRSPFLNNSAAPNSVSGSQTPNNSNLNNTPNTQSVPSSSTGASITSSIPPSGMENDQIESLTASSLETDRGEQDVAPPVTESITTDGLRQRNIDSHPERPQQGPSHVQYAELEPEPEHSVSLVYIKLTELFKLRMSSSKLFVVAIDFGTTYSGYAFSTISEKEQVLTYNWSKGLSQAPKTQTSILFTPRRDFHSFGYEAEEEYARLSQLKENRDWYFFKRFKLTLYKNENLNEKTKIPDCTGKQMQAIEVFSAGIRYLKNHLFTHFNERIPMRDADIHWVLTIPAIWDEAAKKFMRICAEKAGIPGNQLTLALEPESAALYCQLGTHRSGLSPLKPDDKFILLDCGGGTVDITVHEVRLDNSLKEIHRASGGPWGGIKVDDAFQEYLLDLFGFERIASLPKHEVIELERSFELLKKNVNTESKNYHMQLPLILRQSAEPGTLVAGKLRLNSKIVQCFFEKPAANICRHIHDVLLSLREHEIDTILLVGGFAESKVLQEKVQSKFPTIKVLQPNEPGSAVIKGAVEFGHCPEKIRFRMSPYTYGVDTVAPFRHGKDPFSKHWEFDGEAYCLDKFHIHVKKNQSVETGTEISNKNYHPMTKEQTSMNFKIVTSDALSPIYIDDPGNRIIGSFEVRIPNAFSSSERSVNVKMIFRGTELDVEAQDAHTQQKYKTSFKFE
ncbi:Ubiquitin-conjugating enzyme E2 J1,Probable ubiquitin-conjugating enzyme E2 33,Ubiquitin-conjugating enzyme E2 32,Ubiquitin-conjugating enzyme E2 6,Ubiquitin-conjugating enzyme E2 34 [Mytilus edulis]|uniref:Ubiquitin-conjugating enzyme E2 J1,Probable ubiquitin-conjugating enzyme E2 33,Ubiquitin-conjugating enzyme E2 32,Ubiquitin-conjugating enzyme E2 6,Ubiquitin-conjugating enzyme E2 34 n=1 Tax=Mytilus edulis TaxID=6550 RepID=A0A8S3RD49_MYTED|nr:Ubiquitin-conjugating enzyme E2 J1,Probable ubiquitin-conjugating enzyme E2 33,Ubiquitin-conjugating enzyme E2 32,Ubiquitin-conjugating enzyme E2 6,Ubiquitin-conjugating enzyme E2 34 [Mytilus edulis]